MEIRPNAFALRGESGLVKIVSDSVFDPADSGSSLYSDDAQCDIIVESNGFRVNKTVGLNMPRVRLFLRELCTIIVRGKGEARFLDEENGLALVFKNSGSDHVVSFTMNDKREGKENCVQVIYPLEADYYEDLKNQLIGAKILAI
jgi:hypothetical protein